MKGPLYFNSSHITSRNRSNRQQNKSTLTLLFTEAMSAARSYLYVCLSNDTTVLTSKSKPFYTLLFA